MAENPAKEYLWQARNCEELIASKQEELDWLNGIATKVTSSWGNEVVSGSRSQDKIGDVASKIADLRTKINCDIDNLIDKRQEINNTISQLKDADQMRVLRLFYLGHWDQDNGETQYFTWKEIADRIHTSERTAQRIHGNALIAVEKLLKAKS